MTARYEEFKPNFLTDSKKLTRVVEGLLEGNISQCLTTDVMHTSETLAKIIVLNNIAPGFYDEILDIFIPHFIKRHNQSVIGAEAQRRADKDGFGDEWRRAIEAGNSPRQKDFLAFMVAVQMKATGVNQEKAISMAAKQLNRDHGDVKRTVIRSKTRLKK